MRHFKHIPKNSDSQPFLKKSVPNYSLNPNFSQKINKNTQNMDFYSNLFKRPANNLILNFNYKNLMI